VHAEFQLEQIVDGGLDGSDGRIVRSSEVAELVIQILNASIARGFNSTPSAMTPDWLLV
jgi:hypothetical protein